ncbi:MAG: iron ABC transporter permease [Planctomycetota bacterium]|nr:MAG: iron ABC transporter permease [Planctomycetota bacterium]
MTKTTIYYLLFLFLIPTLFYLHINCGEFDIDITKFFLGELSENELVILYDLRITRALKAIFIGGSLAIAGALLQGVFKNPLASPGIVGTSSGAMLGAILIMFIGCTQTYFISLGAFIGSAIATLLVYALSYSYSSRKSDLTTMILIGVAISALCASASSLILSFSLEDWEVGKRMVLWGFGDLGNTQDYEIYILLRVFVIGLIFAIFQIKNLNLMSLGQDTAQSLGVSVELSKFFIIIISSMLAGTAVAFGGMIGFIGLICPHMVRLLFGNNYKHIIPFSCLAGATLLLLVDFLVKYIKLQQEYDLKIGIITSFIGVPFFITLIIKRKLK